MDVLRKLVRVAKRRFLFLDFSEGIGFVSLRGFCLSNETAERGLDYFTLWFKFNVWILDLLNMIILMLIYG